MKHTFFLSSPPTYPTSQQLLFISFPLITVSRDPVPSDPPRIVRRGRARRNVAATAEPSSTADSDANTFPATLPYVESQSSQGRHPAPPAVDVDFASQTFQSPPREPQVDHPDDGIIMGSPFEFATQREELPNIGMDVDDGVDVVLVEEVRVQGAHSPAIGDRAEVNKEITQLQERKAKIESWLENCVYAMSLLSLNRNVGDTRTVLAKLKVEEKKKEQELVEVEDRIVDLMFMY